MKKNVGALEKSAAGLCLCIYLAGLFHRCDGAGMVTHQLTAHRARAYFLPKADPIDGNMDYYYSLLDKYRSVFLGGAPYPDYMFFCGSNHDAGEVSHWEPFHLATVDYINSHKKMKQEGRVDGNISVEINRSSPSWAPEMEKFMAFMAGSLSHFIADVNWHGQQQMASGYGFIQSLGEQNYAEHCDGNLCQEAHTAADVGGEFVASHDVKLGFMKPHEWYVPKKELLGVYAKLGIEVKGWWLTECQAIFGVATVLLQTVARVLFENQTKNSPWMVENYLSYPMGGVDDMAVWSAWTFRRYFNWIHYGASPESGIYNDILGSAFTTGEQVVSKHRHLTRSIISKIKPFQDKLYTMSNCSDGIGDCVFVRKLNCEEYLAVLGETAFADVVFAIRNTIMIPSASNETSPSFESLLDVCSDNENSERDDMVAGEIEEAEAVTKLRRKLRKRGNFRREPSLTQKFNGEKAISYFGNSAMASSDVDGDGIPDLVESQYGYVNEDDKFAGQVGRVTVRMGRLGSTGNAAEDNSFRFESHASLTILGTKRNGRLGMYSTVLDFNSDGIPDLAVAAPNTGNDDFPSNENRPFKYKYFGSVYVFFGPFVKKRDGLLRDSDADVTISTDQIMTNLGSGGLYAIDMDSDGFNDLLISSPMSPLPAATPGDNPNRVICRQCGNVAVFLSGESRSSKNASCYYNLALDASFMMYKPSVRNHIPHSRFHTNYDGEFDLFGTHISFSNGFLFVGSPGLRNQTNYPATTTGGIYVYKLDRDCRSSSGKCLPTLVSTLLPRLQEVQASRNGGFGTTFDVIQANGGSMYLAVSQPYLSSRKGKNAGVVRVYDFLSLIDNTEGGSLPAVITLSNVNMLSGLICDKSLSRFGHSVRWAFADTYPALLVSAPMYKKFSLHHGGYIESGGLFGYSLDGILEESKNKSNKLRKHSESDFSVDGPGSARFGWFVDSFEVRFKEQGTTHFGLVSSAPRSTFSTNRGRDVCDMCGQIFVYRLK